MTSKTENRQWKIHLGLAAPLQLYPFSIRDRLGITFVASLPGQFVTGANQEGVNLILSTSLNSRSALEAIDIIDPVIERVLNIISFRLLAGVFSRALEIIEDRPANEKRETKLVVNYSPQSEGQFQVTGCGSQGGIENFVDMQHSDRVDAAIRWLLKGCRGSNPIDSFGGYWLSLENLITAEESVAPMKMRCCDALIESCPSCGASTIGPTGQKMRMKALFIKAGRDEGYFRKVWALRNLVFHGSSKVSPKMMEIASESLQIRKMAVDIIKERMGIPQNVPPLQGADGHLVAYIALDSSLNPEIPERG